jgi:DNA-binding PadR family transcriptional regulator
MEVDGIEKEVLQKLSERLVMTRAEIKEEIEEKAGDPNALDSVLKSLSAKGYVITVDPIGSACYAVTTKGIKAATVK